MKLYMTEGEIVTSYKQSLYPNDQIKVLAQLNLVSHDDIKEILRKHGALGKVPNKRRRGNGHDGSRQEYYRELARRGLTTREAAEAANVKISTVQRMSELYGIEFKRKQKGVSKKWE